MFNFQKVTGQHNVILTAVEESYFNTRIYAKTEGESSQEDIYCVKNDTAEKDLQTFKDAVNKKTNVILYFSQQYEYLPWDCRDVVTIVPVKN